MPLFSYQAIKMYVLGAQKNGLIEHLQHMFWLRKLIFSYTHLSGGLFLSGD